MHKTLVSRAKSWTPAERLFFLLGWLALAVALLSAIILEFPEGTRWFDVKKKNREFTRDLPSRNDLAQQAKGWRFPASAKLSSYQDISTDFNGIVIATYKYTGYYDPACQQKLDAVRMAAISKESICRDLNAAVARAPLPSGTHPFQSDCGMTLPRQANRPDDKCILSRYGDHYEASVSKASWDMQYLFDSILFMGALILSVASFAAFFLYRPVWIPLRLWVSQG